MINKKILLGLLVLASISAPSDASLAITDMTLPKPPAYRVGISEIPENRYVQPKQDLSVLEQNIEKITNSTPTNENDLSYADLSIKRLSKEIAKDLEFDENDMVADLSLLWQGAAMQSDTINFALYKLSNPDADKPDKKSIKNILKTIASLSTIAGAGISNPLLAGTSIMGSNVLGIMTQDTKELNYKYTKVTDADMIILIRKVEDLQQSAVNLYCDYMTAKKHLDSVNKLVDDRRDKFIMAQKKNASKELVVITDAYYRTALDKQRTARSTFLSKRAALEQFVGNEAFTQFEKDLAARLNSDKTTAKADMSEDNRLAYNETIKNVEDFTNSLSQDNSVNQVEEDKNLSKLEDVTSIEENEKLAFASEEEKQAKKEAREAKRNEKYSTKGLIFLHNNENKNGTQQAAAEQETVQNSEQKTKSRKSKKDKKSKNKKGQTTQNETVEVKNPVPEKVPPVTNLNKPKSNFVNGVELLPLDDIRVPEIQHGRGYSIHAR